jgi:hypothetical protein
MTEADRNRLSAERDMIRADLGELLDALGFADCPRPESPGEAIRQATDEAVNLRKGAWTLGHVVEQLSRSMEAAHIEMRQNGPQQAMQWILNSMSDLYDGEPGTEWDGTESATEWFERTEAKS